MSLINYSSREINCKIVYYGPGLCGKTTNLQHIYSRVPQDTRGNEMLKPYVKAVNELGKEFKVRCVVPVHEIFESARVLRPDIAWAPDGAHPSSSGHMLIARTWLETMQLL